MTSNPYAPPSLAKEAPARSFTPVEGFVGLRMSPTKLCIMLILTFGVYALSWGYRNWSRIRKSGADVWVIPRTIFLGLSLFNLVQRMQLMPGAVASRTPAPRWAAPLYLVSGIGGNVVTRAADGLPLLTMMVLTSGLGIYALCSFQSWVNSVHASINSRDLPEDGINAWVILAGLFGVMFLGLTVLEALAPAGTNY